MDRTWIKKTLLTVLVFMLSLFMLAGCGNETKGEDPAPAQPEQTEATEANTNEQATEADVDTADDEPDDEPAVKPDADFEKGADANTRFIELGNVTARMQIPITEGWRAWPPASEELKNNVILYFTAEDEDPRSTYHSIRLAIDETGSNYVTSGEVTDLGTRDFGGFELNGRQFSDRDGRPLYDFIGEIADGYTIYIYIADLDLDNPEMQEVLDSIKFKVE